MIRVNDMVKRIGVSVKNITTLGSRGGISLDESLQDRDSTK